MKSELAKVGPPWEGGNLERWPGVAGTDGQTNYLAYNDKPFLPDPINSSSTRDIKVGGKLRRKTKRLRRKKTKRSKRNKKKSQKKRKSRMRGGSKHGNTILPQSFVNLGRSAEFNVKGFWNNFTGSPAPVNPDPTVQPISK